MWFALHKCLQWYWLYKPFSLKVVQKDHWRYWWTTQLSTSLSSCQSPEELLHWPTHKDISLAHSCISKTRQTQSPHPSLLYSQCSYIVTCGDKPVPYFINWTLKVVSFWLRYHIQQCLENVTLNDLAHVFLFLENFVNANSADMSPDNNM